jgi:hypothetical protein
MGPRPCHSTSKPFAALPAAALIACALAGMGEAGAADVPYRMSGQGWAEFGRIVHSTDTLLENLNGNTLQSAGAQFTAYADIGESWEGAFGIGGLQVHNMQGNDGNAKIMQFKFRNFITEARMTYYRGDKADPGFSLTFGNFDYAYNPDIKNLGLYLLRGTVYPGFLVSGFRDPGVDPTQGDILGLKMHNTFGKFSQDVVFANERQFPPSFDWSLGYIGKFKPTAYLTFGAGANFYRVLSAQTDLTTPNSEAYAYEGDLVGSGSYHPYDGKFIEVDTSGSGGDRAKWDTVAYTHKGIKLMGMMSFDPKEALGLGGGLGPEDLKLYAEAALIGVKNYGTIYGKRSERIPVVVGFNLPAFGWLDVMSLEVEWYGARYRNDIGKLTDSKKSQLPSPIPMSYKSYDPISDKGGVDPVTGRLLRDSVDAGGTVVTDADGNPIKVAGDLQIRGTALDIENLTQDNWKWSLYMQKTVREHVRFTAQVANDHFRPAPIRGTKYTDVGGTAESSSSLKDWYFMVRMGYFF